LLIFAANQKAKSFLALIERGKSTISFFVFCFQEINEMELIILMISQEKDARGKTKLMVCSQNISFS
jgi:hypothetical protein